MFRLDNLLERWAELYTPLSHNSVSAGSASGAKKSFFRIGMIDAQSYFVRNYNMMNGCCMAYATHVDAESEKNSKFITYRHVIYFLKKQENDPQKTDVTDELAATDARYDTDEMVQDLIAFLREMQTAANNGANGVTVTGLSGAEHFFPITKDERQSWRGMKLDAVSWGTIPPLITGWQLCGITIEQLQPCLLCIHTNKYI